MTRVKRGKITTRIRKKRIKNAKGFRQSWSKLSRPIIQGCLKALSYSYMHRRKNSSVTRSLNIVRVNALVNNCGLPISYNKTISLLRIRTCLLNRKTLSQLGVRDSSVFMGILKYNFN